MPFLVVRNVSCFPCAASSGLKSNFSFVLSHQNGTICEADFGEGLFNLWWDSFGQVGRHVCDEKLSHGKLHYYGGAVYVSLQGELSWM